MNSTIKKKCHREDDVSNENISNCMILMMLANLKKFHCTFIILDIKSSSQSPKLTLKCFSVSMIFESVLKVIPKRYPIVKRVHLNVLKAEVAL